MKKKVLISGVCGFIGICLARRLIADGYKVIGVDNLSRRGSELHAMELSGKQFTLHRVDISNPLKTFDLFAQVAPVDAVFHLAAQVAVTNSYLNRQTDFLDNAVASFNVIEAAKRYTPDAYCLYASTNKVYGHIEVSKPVGLEQPLNPYTPYGVSKSVGELYFTEYGRKEIGLTTCSLRQSCIYGHHQFGVEDQGWLSWFAIANLLRLPVTIYGDGKQVRDLLFVDDLIELYLNCLEKRQTGVFPVGGGSENTINIQQGLDIIAQITGKEFLDIKHDKERSGDQPYFVADLSWTLEYGIDWKPKIAVQEGIRQMINWIEDNLETIKKVLNT
ncbi:MAG: NAD-dependent epimerase/dehydratase family protein [Candidatus Scalinduaceae bacterium]